LSASRGVNFLMREDAGFAGLHALSAPALLHWEKLDQGYMAGVLARGAFGA